ncbi:MAG: nucleotide sugar dehydrogenase [Bacteroidales bacterium]|nr:nucleotide sugar dehydrogenase [Bacteroidales bacterium]
MSVVTGNIEPRICVCCLGYVGLPLARLFAQKYQTIGFDTNEKRVEKIMQGVDDNKELSSEQLSSVISNKYLTCTSDIEAIKGANTYIIAAPTPVNKDNTPDLEPLLEATRTVGKVLSKGDVVIYESTVYPGVTEEECVPILEEVSTLKYNEDFFVGYSPERINPGDKEHTVETICKVTSGSTPETADYVDALYKSVVVGGTHKAPSIRVAEASKIIENAQRDVNIAFMNELAKIFNAMDIDTQDVIEAAATKWNFIKMTPGLVGGHCISVDPYYLIQKAQVYGVMPHIMQASRRLNESMGNYVAQRVITLMNRRGILVRGAKILLLGITFKENCPDIRNTKVVDIYSALKEYTDDICIYDPWANEAEVMKVYGIKIEKRLPEGEAFDAIVHAVSHKEFQSLDYASLRRQSCILYDVKGTLPRGIIDGRL